MSNAGEPRETQANPSPDVLRQWRSVIGALILVIALFLGVVIGVMVVTRLSEPVAAPDTPTLRSMRAALAQSPTNEELKQAIRDEDARARREYLLYRRRLQVGAALLLVGSLALWILTHMYVGLDPKRVRPGALAEREDADRWLAQRRRTRWAMAGGSVVVALGLLAFILIGGPSLPPPAASEGAKPGAAAAPSPAGTEVKPAVEPSAFKEDWPRFRGPTGMGAVRAGDWPSAWNVASGENILWKAAVPAPGNSSPILWGNRLFLTGSDSVRQEVMCFDRRNGTLLWRTEIKPPGSLPKGSYEVLAETGYAAPTPATDGTYVFATFANADIGAVDFSGKVVWSRSLGAPESSYGRATSLVLYDGKLLLQFDRSSSADDKLSSLLALDPKTGKTLWQEPRQAPNSWSTPIVIEVGGKPQLVTCGTPWIIAYDPATGKEIWRVSGLSVDVAPSPVYADGLVFATNAQAQVMAIRPDGEGDVTATHVAWTGKAGMSDAPSPIADARHFLQVDYSGYVTCYDAKTGALRWEATLPSSVWASPTLVGERVYIFAEDGKTFIFPLADSYKLEVTADVGEAVSATPAFADDCIYIRGKQHLFCIGTKRVMEGRGGS